MLATSSTWDSGSGEREMNCSLRKEGILTTVDPRDGCS